MEYRFRKDTLNDSYRVDFSMGHEAFGSWLLNELGPESLKVSELIASLAAVKLLKSEQEVLIEGGDFSLVLTRDDALVRANSLNIDVDLPEGEDFSHYDDELASACGLDDFEIMLESWLAFLPKPRR